MSQVKKNSAKLFFIVILSSGEELGTPPLPSGSASQAVATEGAAAYTQSLLLTGGTGAPLCAPLPSVGVQMGSMMLHLLKVTDSHRLHTVPSAVVL